MTATRTKVLVVGGYGTFGGRLVKLLLNEPRLTLVVAGRSHESASRFCRDAGAAAAELVPARFDREGDLDAQLATIAPNIVVDATGPYQAYGDAPYRLVEAAIRHGAHYLDLADGSDFVRGINAFDGEAKARGVFVLSGVSSFPVLTAAVLREIARDVPQIEDVTAGIAPSPYAGVGLNVIRAIAGYAGQKAKLTREGQWTEGYALAETMRFTVSPPGRLPLHSTHFSLVDVPDLQLVPDLMPDIRTLWVGAGPVPEVLHRMLNMLAWLVRWRVIPSLSPFAGLFYRAINILRWGEHRGGMFVCARGENGLGQQIEHSWHMLAEADDGPFIPSMAIEGIIRKLLDGETPLPGARPATDALSLADYENLFAARDIHFGWRRSEPGDAEMPLYRRMLGDAWDDLPEPVKAMHDSRTSHRAEGFASVERGRGFLSRLTGGLFRFPDNADDIPVSVTFEVGRNCEIWRRTFGRHSFSSTQYAGRGRSRWLICERFGLLTFGLALVFNEGRLHFVVRKWSLAGVPLPLFLAPASRSFESAEDGRFHFDVEISHRLTGLIVRYRGWLEPKP